MVLFSVLCIRILYFVVEQIEDIFEDIILKKRELKEYILNAVQYFWLY